jgi:hypothetical protein
MEQARTSGIMRFSQPHDHGGSSCLPTHHPRSHPAWPSWATLIRSDQPRHRTCWPTSPPSPTPGPALGAGTRWSPSSCSPLLRSWRARGRSPPSPSGPRTHPSPCVPRSEPAAIPSPAAGSSPPRPRSAERSPGSMPRPWPPRSAHGFQTATVLASGDVRSRSTARRCAAPSATAAESTCSPRWTTPPARCSPNAKSTVPQVRCPPSSPCWTGWTLPAWS